MMDKNARIYVAGHRGLVGSALVRQLLREGYSNLLVADRDVVDLSSLMQTHTFLRYSRPEYIFLAAAKVGGIVANNSKPVDFLQNNLEIQTNVIRCAHEFGAKKLLFLGSSCIYPRMAPQPITEDALLTGPLEETNQWYAVAKIAGIKLCQAYRRQYGSDFISVMPTNLYGPGDNYDPEGSHVIPGLIRKFHQAKLGNQPSVPLWGSGMPRREFLYVDDLARACVLLMNEYSDEKIINVGSGSDIAIRDLAEVVKSVVGYEGEIQWDYTRPDGTPRKLMDSSRIRAMNWQPTVTLEDGLKMAYADFLKGQNQSG